MGRYESLSTIPVMTGNVAEDIKRLRQYLVRQQGDLIGESRVPPSDPTKRNQSALLGVLRTQSMLALKDGATDMVTNIPEVPDAPTGVVCTAQAISFVLTWDVPSDPTIKGWEVQRADDSGFTTGVVTLGRASTTAYQDGEMPRGTARYYRVRAIRDDGAPGTWSAVVSGTVGSVTSAHRQEVNLTTFNHSHTDPAVYPRQTMGSTVVTHNLGYRPMVAVCYTGSIIGGTAVTMVGPVITSWTINSFAVNSVLLWWATAASPLSVPGDIIYW